MLLTLDSIPNNCFRAQRTSCHQVTKAAITFPGLIWLFLGGFCSSKPWKQMWPLLWIAKRCCICIVTQLFNIKSGCTNAAENHSWNGWKLKVQNYTFFYLSLSVKNKTSLYSILIRIYLTTITSALLIFNLVIKYCCKIWSLLFFLTKCTWISLGIFLNFANCMLIPYALSSFLFTSSHSKNSWRLNNLFSGVFSRIL